ncbi:PorT family protein [Spirosoma sp. KNUC1025]|uniref:PorT family protein n=1 Tax=Spirosoma sp. KNUC1025 TaxID=2894082 RepID=UPI0038642321|nr:PorT family protein [Spirosoma sp. KNUC1025]
MGQHKLSISSTVTPAIGHTDYHARSLYPESDGQVVEPVFLDGSRWSSGYAAGLSISYVYQPGWSVSSGIWFHQITTRQTRQPSAGEGTVTLRNRRLRIPLLLNFCPSNHRLSPYFSFGLLTDFPILSRVVVTRSGESTQNLRLKPLLPRPFFYGLLGAGVRYKLTDRYTFIGQPVLTYSFGQLGASFMHDPAFEIGLQTQLAYTF